MNPAIHDAAIRFAAERVVPGSQVAIDAFEAGSQVYPLHDNLGPSVILGPECFATGSSMEPVEGTRIAWKGVWFGILTDADPTIGRTVTAREGAGLPEGYILRDKEGDICEAGDPENVPSSYWEPYTVVGKVPPRPRPDDGALRALEIALGLNMPGKAELSTEVLACLRDNDYDITPKVRS